LKYTDHHVHTNYSPDSMASIRDYILRARELKLDYLLFTDHIDFGGTEVDFHDHIDYDEYFKSMKKYEEDFNIPIRVGVEIGYEKNHKNEINEFLSKYPFDFVISSIHYGDGGDFYLGDFFNKKTQYEAYFRYFELVLEMVENFSNYEVLGHLDFIVRYGPFKDKTYNYKDYKEIIDKILVSLIEKGKGIEVNTSGLRGDLNTTFPKEEVIKRYKELGGRIITLGSDAHFNEDFYGGILKVKNTLKSLGFSSISSFKNRKNTQYILK